MGTILATIIMLIIFALFTINKTYVQTLTFLIFYLILDWAIVKFFSTVPLIGYIAISVGAPILMPMLYITLVMVDMGIFYFVLQRYNYIVSMTVFLIINIVLNKIYMTITGNMFLDILINFAIGNIIILICKRIRIIDDVKWFSIVGTIIMAFIQILLSRLSMV